MPRSCERCESQVSKSWFRFASIEDKFGDRKVYSCPECVPEGTILRGPDDDHGSRYYEMYDDP